MAGQSHAAGHLGVSIGSDCQTTRSNTAWPCSWCCSLFAVPQPRADRPSEYGRIPELPTRRESLFIATHSQLCTFMRRSGS